MHRTRVLTSHTRSELHTVLCGCDDRCEEMAGSECRGGSQKPGRIEKGAGPARPVRKLTGHKSSDKSA